MTAAVDRPVSLVPPPAVPLDAVGDWRGVETDLIGELSTRSEVFRTSWAAHNVRCTAAVSNTCTTRSSVS